MTEIILVVILIFGGFMVGATEERATIMERCVAKYADMPHNKVEDYCKTILKFEKDAK